MIQPCRWRVLAVVCCLVGLVACSDNGGDDDPDAGTEDADSNGNGDEDGSDFEAASCEPSDYGELQGEALVEGHTFENPTFMTQAPHDDDTFYVTERAGTIRVVEDGEVRSEPFLDLSEQIDHEYGEQGLLGLAFHPEYEDNGRFFIARTNPDDDNIIAEYQRSDDEEFVADDEEVDRLLDVESDAHHHNGGMLTFRDGLLYASLGDGGGEGDDHGEIGNGQNTETVHGSILRFDVDAPDEDYVPEDNPFVGDDEGHDLVWVHGLRNPWRFSFDREAGNLFIGDPGQDEREEIDFLEAEHEGGANFGWRAFEGTRVFDEELADEIEDEHVEPIYDYATGSDDGPIRSGCAVIGGYVYRGDAIEELQGYYIYSDFCGGSVAALRYCDEDDDGERELVDHHRIDPFDRDAMRLSSLAQDNEGELYLLDHNDGFIDRIVPAESDE